MTEPDLHPDLSPPPAFCPQSAVSRFPAWIQELNDWFRLQQDVLADLMETAWPDGDCPYRLSLEAQTNYSPQEEERFCDLVRVDRIEDVLLLSQWVRTGWASLVQLVDRLDLSWTDRYLIARRLDLVLTASAVRAVLVDRQDHTLRSLQHYIRHHYPLPQEMS